MQQSSVTIQNFAFNPSTITVARRTTVVWTNQEAGVQDTIISDSNVFGSILKPGDSFEVKFNNPGTYNYHCVDTPYMYGTVIVTKLKVQVSLMNFITLIIIIATIRKKSRGV